MVGRDAVLQAVGAARVLRDVAAQGADRLARRIRRVHQPVLGGRRPQVGVLHAGLQPGSPVRRVDLQDPVHPRHLDHHPAVGQRAAGQAGAGAPGDDEREPFPVKDPDDLLHLLRTVHEHHGQRCRPVNRDRVRLERKQLARLGEERSTTDDPGKSVAESAG